MTPCPSPWLVVSLHDVAPATFARSRAWVEHFDRRGLRVALLVVPGPWAGHHGIADDPGLASWLAARVASGDEVVQHGWTHTAVDGNGRGRAARAVGEVLARGCGEFWMLEHQEATCRLLAGRDAMHDVGLRAAGFVAPGWLLSPAAQRALADLRFRYTTDHRGVIDLVHLRRLSCPALSQRAGSPITGAAARATSAMASLAIRRRRPLRIAAHPADLDDCRAVDAVLDACDAALAAGYRSTTYLGVVDELTGSRQEVLSSA